MDEIWKDIQGYEGEYQVSNFGNVRSLPRIIKYENGQIHHYIGRLLKTYKATNGYVLVTLTRKHKGSNFLVHRLVASAFIANPNKLPEINHLDENKLNNNAANLEWCSIKDNRNYGTRNQRAAQNKDYKKIGKRNKALQGKKVLRLSNDGKVLEEYASIHEAERITGFARQAISACCGGKMKRAYGYKWEFVDKQNPRTEIEVIEDGGKTNVCQSDH